MQSTLQTTTLPSQLSLLASPPPTFIDDTLPAYLSLAMIRTLRESTRVAVEREMKTEMELEAEGLIDKQPNEANVGEGKVEERVESGLRGRLHTIGVSVGGHIAERLIAQRPSLPSQLDVIKFLCKDFFLYVYARQIDNLRTNHRGIYVLQSTAFPPLVPISSYRGSQSDLHSSQIYLVLPAAMMQGCLERLGLPSTVTAESTGLPQCTFSIKTRTKETGPVPGTGQSMSTTTAGLPPRAE